MNETRCRDVRTKENRQWRDLSKEQDRLTIRAPAADPRTRHHFLITASASWAHRKAKGWCGGRAGGQSWARASGTSASLSGSVLWAPLVCEGVEGAGGASPAVTRYWGSRRQSLAHPPPGK